MKLIDALNNVDKSESNESSIPWEDFLRACDIYDNMGWSEDTRLKGYWLKTWVCTDTRVGYAAYYLNDKLVAISGQTARRDDVEIEFMDQDSGVKVRKYLRELLGEDEKCFTVVESLDSEFWRD